MTSSQSSLLKNYKIGNKVYYLKPLVLGQIRQLIKLLSGVSIDLNAGIGALIQALGELLPAALAIVLTPEGIKPKDKDLEAIAQELEDDITLDLIVEVINDFFVLNPISSVLTQLNQKIQNLTMATPSLGQSSSWQTGTSQRHPESSGDTVLEMSSPSSDTKSNK